VGEEFRVPAWIKRSAAHSRILQQGPALLLRTALGSIAQGAGVGHMEEEFFKSGDVLVTRTRAIFGGTTFAISNVSLVRLHYVRKLAYWTIALLVLASLALLAGFNQPEYEPTRNIIIGIGVLLIIIAVVVQHFWPRKEYTFELKANSGDMHRFTIEDQKFAEGVKNAIEQAISLRV
jgi:hypothetical protein